jgi:16S rRNA (cytidine1402-2'-O)-methyltransferase
MTKTTHAGQPDRNVSARPKTYTLYGRAIEAGPIPSGLYVVATPIGNLEDVTLRALRTLAASDLVACEDTRVTRKLLDRYGIFTPLTPYHEHNASAARPKILRHLDAGAAVALVSDAGTPLVSDPGFKLVRAVQEAGHPVVVVPGASATLAAIAVAGLPTDRFFFEGFLPSKQAARRSRIAALAEIPATLVLFETGPRIASTLADLADGLGDREAAICRELTKLHEEVRRGTLSALADNYAGNAETRGEFVLVIAPPGDVPVAAGEVDALLRAAMRTASLKDAVASVAAATGQPRRTVYRRALEMAEDEGDGTD